MIPSSTPSSTLCSRRHFLHTGSFGLGSLALASLLREECLLGAPVKPALGAETYDLKPKVPSGAGKAKAMISLFMMGGPSQMDLFDPKPMLAKYDGKAFPGEIQYDNVAQASSKVFASPWSFQKSGQCGTELSELLPNLQRIADDITVMRSMRSGLSNHLGGMLAMLTGKGTRGRPTLGAWITYALGSESRNLPAFVALAHPSGLPTFQHEHWSNGWLPSPYQGTLVRAVSPYILNLDPPKALVGAPQSRQLELLQQLNERHLGAHPGEQELSARIASYELAGRMQTAAKEALDVSSEPEHIQRLYGLDNPVTADYGRRCLMARRLIERGVRYVQVLNNGQSWDHHGSLISALPARCAETDQPSAALVLDLKQRGLLDSTVVHWGGEMGRLPVLQNDAGRDKWGRDHNTHGFSQWVAGGGFRGGCVHGETDEFGHRAVKDIVNHYDWHATLLHCFGFDHAKLGFVRNGTQLTLTDGQGARVVSEILA